MPTALSRPRPLAARLALLCALLPLAVGACGGDSDSSGDSDTGAAADSGAEAGSGAEADTGTEADTGAEADSSAQADTGAEADTGTEADSGGEADSSAQADTATDTEADTAPPPDSYAACWPDFAESVGIEIDSLGLPVSTTCAGTTQQEFANIERVVFLGDSITNGTGGGSNGAYRDLLAERLRARYPDVRIDDCSRGGAVNGDLLASQIPDCFPDPETRKTLVIFTSGGNDVVRLAFQKASLADAMPAIDGFVGQLRDALAYLADPANVPGGARIVFANVYEFTDATGLMSSCPLAAMAGLTGTWDDGIAAYAYMERKYAEAAQTYGFDVMFLEETFCGHGYNRNAPESPCVARAGDIWIGPDCIHPNVAGHRAIADQFWHLISGE